MQSTPPKPSGHEHWPLKVLHSANWPQLKAGRRQLKLAQQEGQSLRNESKAPHVANTQREKG